MAKKEAEFVLDVFKQLQEMLNLLPSQEEQSRALDAVQRVTGFLDRIAQALRMVPTREEILENQIPQSLDQITGVLRGLNAVSKTPSAREKRRAQARQEISPQAVLQYLESVPSERLEEGLRQSKVTVNDLRAILEYLGASTRGATKKEDLMRRVADEIRTRRDLSGLRDGAAP